MDTFYDAPAPPAHHLRADHSEAQAFADFYSRCPADVRLSYGVDVRTWPGAIGFCAPGTHTLYFNRTIVLRPERIDESVIKAIQTWYAYVGSKRYFVQVPPPEPAFDDLLTAAGLQPYNRWAKLTRTARSIPDVESHAQAERIHAGTSATFGAILTRCFEWPDAFVPWLEELVGAPGWHTYLARIENAIVGVGAMNLVDRTAYMGPAATMPEARGRGAQTALIAARLREAIALGATNFVTETAEDTSSRSAPSYRNLRRYGFGVYYLRENYIGYTE
jgi:ribosomal protein S18 acetylase RimI-like enzyme